MATQTTPLSPAGWRPDVTAYTPGDVIPDALVLTTATVVGHIEGDEPSIRVPFVADDGVVGFIAEGDPIDDAAQDFSEVVVQTNKVAALGKYSYETLAQPEAARMVTDSLRRSVVNKANAAYLGNLSAPTGLLNLAVTDGGDITVDLDPVVDAIAGIEAAGGNATNIIASPDAWATLSKLKVTDTSAQPLIGPDVTASGQRQLLGVPVSVTNAMPTGGLLVVDRGSVIAAVSPVRLARSEDAFFANDVVAIRLTFRLGWDVMHLDRVAKLTTVAGS